jgi:hypothetical protein
MRIEVHVATVDEADAVRARYAGSADEIVIVVGQPAPILSTPRAAERQTRKSPTGAR